MTTTIAFSNPNLGWAGVSDQIFDIIADETCATREDILDVESFFELGIDDFLSKAISSKIRLNLNLNIPNSALRDYPRVSDFKTYIQSVSDQSVSQSTPQKPVRTTQRRPCPQQSKEASPPPTSQPHIEKSQPREPRPKLRAKAHSTNSSPTRRPRRPQSASVPLSVILQGNPKACKHTVFLFPDGSGSGMSYARFPKLSEDVCLIALNSPYLTTASASVAQTTSIEKLVSTWITEIRQRQPHGPYILGGWSAGGYYTFEATKQLMQQGEAVSKLLLIDSPCRLEYEALPDDVLEYLSSNNLFGNKSPTGTPDWLLKHFQFTIAAVEKYMPTPLDINELPREHRRLPVPEVFCLWASEGLLSSNPEEIQKMGEAGIDMSVKVTKCLVEGKKVFGPNAWDRLFPSGTQIHCAKTDGHHFNMVYAPQCHKLGPLLNDAVTRDNHATVKGKWTS